MVQVDNLNTDTAASEAAVPQPAGAPGVVYVTDSTGRRIGLKKLRPSARYLLAKAIEFTNQSTELQAVFVATVFSIGDEAFTPLTGEPDLLRRLDELDDAGLLAVTKACLPMYGMALDTKDVEIAKNS